MQHTKNSLLIVWQESCLGLCAAQDMLDRLAQYWPARLGLCIEQACGNTTPTPCAGRQPQANSSQQLADGYDRFLLPMLPGEMLDAISQASFEQPAAAVILCALFSGKDVMVLRSGVEPQAPVHLCETSPVFIAHREKIKRIQAMGIRIVNENELMLPKVLKPEKAAVSQIIVEQDILRLAARGESVLELAGEQKLTPLAQDTAKAKNITIKRMVKP